MKNLETPRKTGRLPGKSGELAGMKVVVVLAKLTLFVQSCRRSLHKVDVVCTKFCTKKEESWQVNIFIKTAS